MVSVNPGVSANEAYNIIIARGLFPKIPSLVKNIQGKKRLKIHRVAVITDSTLREIYGERLSAMFGGDSCLLHVPAGEASKCREMKNYLEDRLVEAKFGRDSAIIAFGGGVVGDLAGFVASTYYRGIPYFQVPTTIISQVDSSIGGKTAIDLPSGKNLVGSFYQPKGVFMDVDLLDTLPEVEFVNGLAEVVKHAMIRDRKFFEFLEENVSRILSKDKKILVEMLGNSCAIKADVVSQDIKETNLRKILNFGHTVGHALETLSGYGLLHGQAVSIGMAAEAYISVKAGYLAPEKYMRLYKLLRKFGLPTKFPSKTPPERIVAVMGLDKKNEKGRVHYTLPSGIGEMKRVHGKYGIPVNMPLVEEALKELARNPDGA